MLTWERVQIFAPCRPHTNCRGATTARFVRRAWVSTVSTHAAQVSFDSSFVAPAVPAAAGLTPLHQPLQVVVDFPYARRLFSSTFFSLLDTASDLVDLSQYPPGQPPIAPRSRAASAPAPGAWSPLMLAGATVASVVVVVVVAVAVRRLHGRAAPKEKRH